MTASTFERVRRQLSTPGEPSPATDDEDDADRRTGRSASGATIRDVITYGSLGGLVATLSMTVFRLPTSKSLPPTAKFWAKFVGSGDPEDYPITALVLHLLYGVASGVVYALLTPGEGDPEAAAEAKSALLGTAFGTALSVFGSRVVLVQVLGVDPDRDELLVFHISHVVYGLTLGTWVGSRFGRSQ
jgi:hypothetical protein